MTFKTIRQVAATGLLPENTLRMMQKEGVLPGFQRGKWFFVNVEMLEEVLREMSKPKEEDA